MTPIVANLFASLPPGGGAEQTQALLARPGLKIERIVSHGQTTPPGRWYDQDQDEWVLVVTGAATLKFETDLTPCRLGPGDYLLIPAHCRHRVEWTDPKVATVWLALHLDPPPAARAG